MQVRGCCVLVALAGQAAACADVSDDPGAGVAVSHADSPRAAREFTETYGLASVDAGHWALSTNTSRPREIEPSGGNPGGYLYSEVASPIPTWTTVSARVQPDGGPIRDTIFVGDYRASDIRWLTADLCVYRAGSWSASRTVSLRLTRWDVANDAPAVSATHSLPDISEVPKGWQRYVFEVDARSQQIPPGWSVMRGDGTPGDDSDWSSLMSQVDVVSFGYWKPGYVYPALGQWQLGLDNVHIASW